MSNLTVLGTVPVNLGPAGATLTNNGTATVSYAASQNPSVSADGTIAAAASVILYGQQYLYAASRTEMLLMPFAGRVQTVASSTTPSINTDVVSLFVITAQTAAITSFTTNLTGNPVDGQSLWIAITGTAARGITWGAAFEASTVALPTTTVTTARLDCQFIYNAATAKWRCVTAV